MTNRTLVLIGWLLFTLSALGYIIASIGDAWGLFASICFLVACFAFLIAHFRDSR